MIMLAHRGWWHAPTEKNSQAAILRAFAAGYGVETDVRDHDGELVLAHDVPVGADLVPFEWVIEQFARHGEPGALAINIKADGLQAPLKAMLQRHGIRRAFVFDMAVPDALGYLAGGFTTYTRHSEVEPVPAFYARASGVWMDCFESDWVTAEDVRRHVANGKTVALVSPELHRRSHAAAWAAWRELAGDPHVMLCTDLPHLWPADAAAAT